MNKQEILSRGRRLFSQGLFPQAETVIREILLVDPEDFEAINDLGVIAYTQGQVNQAENYFLQAKKIKGDYSSALMNLADLYQDLGKTQSAIDELKTYVLLNPEDVEAKARLAGLDSTAVTPAPSISTTPLAANVPLQQNSVIPKAATTFNVLFFQDSPCIRNYKYATALRARGHRVTLAYTERKLSERYSALSDSTYNDSIKIKTLPQLWDLIGHYDLIHCHNEPDQWTVAALAGSRPVIHDTHDLISLRANGDPNLSFLEGIANRGATGRVYSTPYQRDEAKNLYGIDGPSLVMYNYISAAHAPSKFLPKRSKQDGKTHIVYEGGIHLSNNHRNFSALFTELASKGIEIHIYPDKYVPETEAFFAKHPGVHYNHPVSPEILIEEMTQYDIGIIPFNLELGNKRFLDSTIANKLFEYMAAGLSVTTSPLQTYTDYFRENPVGCTFQNADDIIRNIPQLKRIAETTDFSSYVCSYESEINRLEDFYQELLSGWNGKQAQH